MEDKLYDKQAWVCTNCLFLIANGDGPDFAYQYPEKSEEEIIEMERDYDARIAAETEGFNITLGHVWEEHACASNVTVTPIYRTDQDNGVTVHYQRAESAREYRADTVSEAIEQAEIDFPDAIGFRGVSHELETEGDRGGECDCEELSFSTQDCANCGTRYAGSWYAATVWRKGKA